MPGTRHPSSREEGGDYRAEEKFGRSRKGEVKTEAREARALLICEWNLMLPQAFPGRGTIPLAPTVMEGCRRLVHWMSRKG